MGRVEDNIEILSLIQKSGGNADKLSLIALVLCDISRSLAIIADKMETKNEETD